MYHHTSTQLQFSLFSILLEVGIIQRPQPNASYITAGAERDVESLSPERKGRGVALGSEMTGLTGSTVINFTLTGIDMFVQPTNRLGG